MSLKNFTNLAYTLSLSFGGLAALLCIAANFLHFLIIISLFCGFTGFALCCIHIVRCQRIEGSKQAPSGMLLLSLLLNSAPLLFMMFVVFLSKRN